MGVHLAALHCGVFPSTSRPPSEDGQGRTTDATPLIRRAFTRFHPLHQPVTGRTHVVGPGRVSRGPRMRVCETRTQAPSPFHHLDASRWHPHVNEPRTSYARVPVLSIPGQQLSV